MPRLKKCFWQQGRVGRDGILLGGAGGAEKCQQVAVDRLPDAGKCVSEQLDCCWTWGLLTLGIQKGAEGAS